jgi:hypothetical protein
MSYTANAAAAENCFRGSVKARAPIARHPGLSMGTQTR